MLNMNNVLAVILGGGRGTRMRPLTQTRSKPAVPIAGKYRLIDIPISNCINSGIYHIAVLTQFNSASLHRHISGAYNLNAFRGSVQLLAAAQTHEREDWYQGTADAVRKQLVEIQSSGAEVTLILAGDHLYRMDYEEMAKFHWENKADITVAVQPVARSDASRLGILKCESDFRISNFVEKPTDAETQNKFISGDDSQMPFLGSMGIYMFNTKTLIDLLTRNPGDDDFGSDVIPNAIHSHAVYGYVFDGYWRDIGTIRSFYETNLAFTTSNSPFSFHCSKFPIYTAAQSLPSSVIENSELKDVMLAEGCQVFGAKIEHSVIGSCSQISSGVTIKDCIVMGADHYERRLAVNKLTNHGQMEKRQSTVARGIGPNCSIEGAILDKNVRIGEGVIIRPFPREVEMECGNWFVREGIVVIPKDAEIPAGTVITPEVFRFNKFSIQKVDSLCFDIVTGNQTENLWRKSPSRKVLEAVL
ncbi:MAG: sugar phosphate nucleotidyltransferase [Chloroflexi bacterium]|nr:sugar phosphate nucleotidyltransferase [Chloroflexota bacterium]